MLCAIALSACGTPEANFSQYPGFAEYFAAHPRSEHAAAAAERALLRRYKPRLFVGPDQDGPIRFYGDYIANGALYDSDGRLISREVNRAALNAYKHDPLVTFVHRPMPAEGLPTVFGRVDYEAVADLGLFTFLTYHFAFRHSGIPLGIPDWQHVLLELIGDTDDWHQLDHYTAVTIAFDPAMHPVAVILQHHNYQRTYLIGRELRLSPRGDLRLVAALGSNELYPYRKQRTRHRAVSFITPEGLRYLVTGDDAPFFTADDIAVPKREVDYRLKFLPHDDAFYVFEGYLGERRWLPGRDGPPGADYNTLPRFKGYAVQLIAFNWRDGANEQMQELSNFITNPSEAAFVPLLKRFRQALTRLEE